MDRLNPLDALFVDAEDEDRHTSMAIASIAVFEGPAPSHEETLAFLAGRLPTVPRYRQKLRTVPLRLGRPEPGPADPDPEPAGQLLSWTHRARRCLDLFRTEGPGMGDDWPG